MNNEIEVLKQFFAAINRNDLQGITTHFDPQLVRIEPEGFPTAGAYHGIAEVQDHVAQGRGTWAAGTCEPEEFLTNADKVVVYLHVWVRLQDSPDWGGGRFADGFVLCEGKITQYLSFGERLDALKWAGIEEHFDAFRGNLFARHDSHGREQTVAIDWAFVGSGPIGAEMVW